MLTLRVYTLTVWWLDVSYNTFKKFMVAISLLHQHCRAVSCVVDFLEL